VLSMGLVEPLIAVLLGAVFLHERLTVITGVGGICILAAVAVVLDVGRTTDSARQAGSGPSRPDDRITSSDDGS
jgi:threonine/homoserine efflux transporter RhtA